MLQVAHHHPLWHTVVHNKNHLNKILFTNIINLYKSGNEESETIEVIITTKT